jgi:'Cold-shock' DNA-binding domain
VHASALNRAGINELAEGQRVAVDVVEGGKGPEAARSAIFAKRTPTTAAPKPNPHSPRSAHRLPAGSFHRRLSDAGLSPGSIARARPASETLPDTGRSRGHYRTAGVDPELPIDLTPEALTRSSRSSAMAAGDNLRSEFKRSDTGASITPVNLIVS